MILLALLACNRTVDSAAPVELPEGFEAGPERVCDAPVSGFVRLEEQGQSRGLTQQNPDTSEARSCPTIPGGVVASDLDGDGDPDLLFNNPLGAPWIYSNEGGVFTEGPTGSSPYSDRRVEAIGAFDLDGDGLPELLAVGEGMALLAHNEGELQFSTWEAIFYQDDYPHTCFVTATWGDIDQDGDLDIALPAADPVPTPGHVMIDDPDSLVGDLSRVLLNEGGDFSTVLELVRGGAQGLSLYGSMADIDRNGSLELLIGADRPVGDMPPMAVYTVQTESDPPRMLDIAPMIGFSLPLPAMGSGVADLNGDGGPDYVFSDLSPRVAAVLSDGAGAFYEAGAALGLNAPHTANPGFAQVEDPEQSINEWATWSVELEDLDNDGHEDLAAVSGQLPNEGNPHRSWVSDFQPDALYQGMDGGLFLERGARTDFARIDNRYGMAAADFDGDGYRDLVVGPYEGSPLFWSNPCGEGAWLEIRLIGPAENPEGWGATVVAESGGQLWLRQVVGLRTVGQSTPSVHFGLGELDQLESLRVEWPDGVIQEAEAVPTRRELVVRHPE